MPSDRKTCCICKSGVSSRFHATAIYKDDLQFCFLLQEDREGFLCGTCMGCVTKFRENNSLNFKHCVDCKIQSGKRQIGGQRSRCVKEQEERGASADYDSSEVAKLKGQIGMLEAEIKRLKIFEKHVSEQLGVDSSIGVQQLRSEALNYIVKN